MTAIHDVEHPTIEPVDQRVAERAIERELHRVICGGVHHRGTVRRCHNLAPNVVVGLAMGPDRIVLVQWL